MTEQPPDMMSKHHHPPLFDAPGSPLHGKVRPASWPGLTFAGKCQALVATRLAPDFRTAAHLMGRHSVAVRRARAAAAAAPTMKRVSTGKWWDR